MLITHESEVAARASRVIQIRDGQVWVPEPASSLAGAAAAGGRP